jgi:hypothetical protein
MTHITISKSYRSSPVIAVISAESATDWISYKGLVSRAQRGLLDLEFRKDAIVIANHHEVILHNIRKL